MKIVQISAISSESEEKDMIYGLGDDNKIYRWKYSAEKWVLDSEIGDRNFNFGN
jgi:hypothetical protein